MNKTTEALKLAEEAAEFARNICLGMSWSTDLPDEALAAIREALADQFPDATKMIAVPVAPTRAMLDAGHSDLTLEHGIDPMLKKAWSQMLDAAPVSAKREWVDLTDDEVNEIVHEKVMDMRMTYKDLVRAVIAAFKEKNK